MHLRGRIRVDYLPTNCLLSPCLRRRVRVDELRCAHEAVEDVIGAQQLRHRPDAAWLGVGLGVGLGSGFGQGFGFGLGLRLGSSLPTSMHPAPSNALPFQKAQRSARPQVAP